MESRVNVFADFPLWIVFCRSLVAASALERQPVPGSTIDAVLDLSKAAGVALWQAFEKLSSRNDLSFQWTTLSNAITGFLTMESEPERPVRSLARRTRELFTRSLCVYKISNIDTSDMLFDTCKKVLGPDLRRAFHKASHFWDCGSIRPQMPDLEVSFRNCRHSYRGLSGYGIGMGYRRKSEGESGPGTIKIEWGSTSALAAISNRTKQRDIQDYCRFRVALTHEMMHHVAPTSEEQTRVHNSRMLHGWATYLQVLDSYEMSSFRADPVSKLACLTLKSLLAKDADENENSVAFTSNYFVDVGTATQTLKGWDLARDLSGVFETLSAEVMYACPFYHSPQKLSHYGLLHALTRANCVHEDRRMRTVSCAQEKMYGTNIRVCAPLKKLWDANVSKIELFVEDLEEMFSEDRPMKSQYTVYS